MSPSTPTIISPLPVKLRGALPTSLRLTLYPIKPPAVKLVGRPLNANGVSRSVAGVRTSGQPVELGMLADAADAANVEYDTGYQDDADEVEWNAGYAAGEVETWGRPEQRTAGSRKNRLAPGSIDVPPIEVPPPKPPACPPVQVEGVVAAGAGCAGLAGSATRAGCAGRARRATRAGRATWGGRLTWARRLKWARRLTRCLT